MPGRRLLNQKNPTVDIYLKNAKSWRAEMYALRKILTTLDLQEEFKWRLPCYCFEVAKGTKGANGASGANIVIMQPFKSCLALMFFSGALLKDTKGILVANGPNSRYSKRMEFQSVGEIVKTAAQIKLYVKEAVTVAKSGQKLPIKRKSEQLPVELKKVFAKNSKLKKAFQELTPGRRRAYILHFSGAKQSATRLSRIERCIPRILDRKGLVDR